MVNVEFPPNWGGRQRQLEPDNTWLFPTDTTDDKPKERHIKEVKKGILIKYEDGSYSFIATDDECWTKIKEALNNDK